MNWIDINGMRSILIIPSSLTDKDLCQLPWVSLHDRMTNSITDESSNGHVSRLCTVVSRKYLRRVYTSHSITCPMNKLGGLRQSVKHSKLCSRDQISEIFIMGGCRSSKKHPHKISNFLLVTSINRGGVE